MFKDIKRTLDPEAGIAIWPTIETEASVKNTSEIAAGQCIVGLFIGPSDLAFSFSNEADHPAFHAGRLFCR